MKKLTTIIGFTIAIIILTGCQSSRIPFFPSWMQSGSINKDAPKQRWKMRENGSIIWDIENEKSLPHYDHIEMAGFKSALLLSYGISEDKKLVMQKHIIWPSLRKRPNNTHASLAHNFNESIRPKIIINNKEITDFFPTQIELNGMVKIYSTTNSPLNIERTLFPAPNNPGIIEEWRIINPTDESQNINITNPAYSFSTPASQGVLGTYKIEAFTNINGDFTIEKGKDLKFYLYFTAGTPKKIDYNVDYIDQKENREKMITEIWSSLILETPNPILNRAFQFAKLRASESIFETKKGLMHSPGGGSYYAALWTNDQCEYVNPFFPFSGYKTGNDEAINCYRLYKPYMDANYSDLVTSIIAEGDGVWNGAGDRGDAAMYSYGASRFALAYGDKEIAKELWPMIKWGLEYSRRKLNDDGIVLSDSDELEGRFPTGDANLCTSSLYYDALISASYLAKEFKMAKTADKYEKQAKKLRRAIEKQFGKEINGFKTYQYFKGNKKLRSWIAIPLTVGIFDRMRGTTAALYSDNLWFGNGMLTEAGSETFWDRSTLYAFRGALFAGETQKTIEKLEDYSQKRLLGEHVPYPVEAWPEGNQKHLSAESGLYCRIYTEGLFGIRPTGLKSFTMIPRLPKKWDQMGLKNIKLFGEDFSIKIKREGDFLRVQIKNRGKKVIDTKVIHGEVVAIKLK